MTGQDLSGCHVGDWDVVEMDPVDPSRSAWKCRCRRCHQTRYFTDEELRGTLPKCTCSRLMPERLTRLKKQLLALPIKDVRLRRGNLEERRRRIALTIKRSDPDTVQWFLRQLFTPDEYRLLGSLILHEVEVDKLPKRLIRNRSIAQLTQQLIQKGVKILTPNREAMVLTPRHRQRFEEEFEIDAIFLDLKIADFYISERLINVLTKARFYSIEDILNISMLDLFLLLEPLTIRDVCRIHRLMTTLDRFRVPRQFFELPMSVLPLNVRQLRLLGRHNLEILEDLHGVNLEEWRCSEELNDALFLTVLLELNRFMRQQGAIHDDDDPG